MVLRELMNTYYSGGPARYRGAAHQRQQYNRHLVLAVVDQDFGPFGGEWLSMQLFRARHCHGLLLGLSEGKSPCLRLRNPW